LRIIEVAHQVWFAVGTGSASHPADLAAAEGLTAGRRAERLAARSLLRQLLRHVAAAAVDAEIEADPGGRPRLLGHPGVGISLSHDGDLAAAAVAISRRVGVDLQQLVNPIHERTARRILGPHASSVLSAPDAGAYELAAVWSAQEACVKAAGIGLAGRPWSIPVAPQQTEGRWENYRWVTMRERPAPISVAYFESQRS
jgi:4'-phosphopantetheinyl transferase